MRRKVKIFRRTKNGKVYEYPWIGYAYRNKKGIPDFKREVCLKGLPQEVVDLIAEGLRGEETAKGTVAQDVAFLGAVSIGAEWTALRIAEQLGIVKELEQLPPETREAVLCMVLDRVLNVRPYSKRALYAAVPASGLERVVCPSGLSVKQRDFYLALGKLRDAQTAIEKRLFRRRRRSVDGAPELFLYDVTGSYLEGDPCPLASFGYNRDGVKGKKQIVVGVLTDSEGFPVSAEVFEGAASDQTTVLAQIEKMRKRFRVKDLVYVRDRGTLTSVQHRDLDAPRSEGVRYITALPRQEIRRLLDDASHPLHPGLFDGRDLSEVEHEGVRYVLCRNPEKTHDEGRGPEYEAADGCWVIATDVSRDRADAEEVRRRYRSLMLLQQVFRTLKRTDLCVPPVRQWNMKRVRGHVFMCVLAYMIVWEARRRFAPFLGKDENDESGAALFESLRCIWERLATVQIGRILIDNRTVEQVNPVEGEARMLLKAASASIDAAARRRLRVTR